MAAALAPPDIGVLVVRPPRRLDLRLFQEAARDGDYVGQPNVEGIAVTVADDVIVGCIQQEVCGHIASRPSLAGGA